MHSTVNPFDGTLQARVEPTWTLEEYLQHPAPSRSDLWRIHKGGVYAWKWAKDHDSGEETDAMRLGTAVHTAVLEPETFDVRVTVFDGTRRGKAWEEFKEKNPDTTILTPAQFERATAMREYVLNEPKLSRLFAEGEPERSIVWTDTDWGVEVKARPDWLDVARGRVVDLKTSADLSDWGMLKSVRSFGYALQAHMFLEACRATEEYARVSDVWLLFVASTGEPRAELVRIPEPALDAGRAVYASSLKAYAEYQRTGECPRPKIVPRDLFWETVA